MRRPASACHAWCVARIGRVGGSVGVTIRFLVNVLIFLGSAAVGLWVTSLFVDGFSITGMGIVTAVLIFAILQSILSPLILKLTAKYASAFTGGMGLVST